MRQLVYQLYRKKIIFNVSLVDGKIKGAHNIFYVFFLYHMLKILA